jgi:hypothetical protein
VNSGSKNMKSNKALSRLTLMTVLQLGVLVGSAQTNKCLFRGSKTNITLNPGTYIITAYGAPGAASDSDNGAEMSAEFDFSTTTNFTLLVGGMGPAVTRRTMPGRKPVAQRENSRHPA